MQMDELGAAEISASQLSVALKGRLTGVTATQALSAQKLAGRAALAPALIEVLEDPDATGEARAVALRALGAEKGAEAEPALIASLRSDTSRDVRLAAQSLGKIGGEKALEALQSLRLRDGHPAAKATLAASRQIAFRNGLKGFELKRPDSDAILKLPRAGSLTMKQRIVPRDEGESIADRLSAATPAFAFEPKAMVELVCAGATLWVAPEKSILGKKGAARLAKAPSAPIMIYGFNDCSMRPYVYAHVFAQPKRGGLDLFAMRSRGDITHSGSAKIGERQIDFELSALADNLSPAVQIEGALDVGKSALAVKTARFNPTPQKGQRRSREPGADD